MAQGKKTIDLADCVAFPCHREINVQLLNFPRDIENYAQHKKLVELVGAVHAGYIVFRLWVELGYQLEYLGRAGRFDKSRADALIVGGVGIDELIKSGYLEECGDSLWRCRIFESKNHHLDEDFVCIDPKIDRATAVFLSAAMSDAEEITPTILPQCWTTVENVQISLGEMTRIVTLIRVMERIFQESHRPVALYERGMISEAREIVLQFDARRLEMYIRLFIARFKRNQDWAPKTTPQFIKEFKTVYLKLLPEGGEAFTNGES